MFEINVTYNLYEEYIEKYYKEFVVYALYGKLIVPVRIAWDHADDAIYVVLLDSPTETLFVIPGDDRFIKKPMKEIFEDARKEVKDKYKVIIEELSNKGKITLDTLKIILPNVNNLASISKTLYKTKYFWEF